MKTFKEFAYEVLKQFDIGLHSKEITRRAIKLGLQTRGKSPALTMNAVLLIDIKNNGKKSVFKKVGPSKFALNKKISINKSAFKEKEFKIVGVSTKQKGDIAEAKIIELITLYGNKALSCYKPVSDDEGIDLIVKEKEKSKVVFVQVKSVWSKRSSFVTTVKNQKSLHHNNSFLIFCLFDTSVGDFWEYLWLIPVKKFTRRVNLNKNNNRYPFVAGFNNNESNIWNEYLNAKNDLANEIIKYLKK